MSLQDTIKQFQTLPQNIQQALSSDSAMAVLENIEKKYNTKLASIVLRAAVKEFPFEDLGIVIKKELKIKPEQAGVLKDEILDQVFAPVMDYYTSAERETGNVQQVAQNVSEKNVSGSGFQASGQMVSFRLPQKRPAGIPPPRPAAIPESGMKNQELRKMSAQPPIVTKSTLPPVQTKVASQPSAPPVPAPRILPPKQPASRSYFYFDVDDEKDVEVFKKHAAVASSTPKEFTTAITKAADKVIASSLVRLPDDVSKKRLQSILMTRFRDIRDSLETKEMLARPVPLGGMGFDAVAIEKIMALAETEFDVIHGDVAEQRGTSEAEEPRDKEESRSKNQEVMEKAGQVSPVEIQLADKSDYEKKTPPTTTNYKLETRNSQNIRTERPVVVDTNRPKIAEVKPASRLTGPLDEIEQMNLRDLRRFTQNPAGFIDRMKERMKLLEEESFEKRMSGLSSWRKSPLFQQYLEVIRSALERNVGIPEMIGSVNDSQSSFMNLSEWQTVNRLNRELKS